MASGLMPFCSSFSMVPTACFMALVYTEFSEVEASVYFRALVKLVLTSPGNTQAQSMPKGFISKLNASVNANMADFTDE